MNNTMIKEWHKLSENTRRNIFVETAKEIGLPDAAIEKDWWVVRVLDIVFNSSIAPYTVFKGGTSLSKAWNLIDRFSEDIDLALDRKFLGFEKADHEMTASQVRKLRKTSSKFIAETYFAELSKKFLKAGFKDVKLTLGEIKTEDQDPLIIEINYHSVTESDVYLQPRILIEVGSRSMREPYEQCTFTSFVDEKYKGQPFADTPIMIPTVRPERTFLEKIFLLHEEFQKPAGKIKVERKSRHLYDLEKLMDTKYAKAALANKELYNTIVEHRKMLTPIRGIDYANHIPAKINSIPPNEVIADWERDYKTMQESMLYGTSLPFDVLIQRIKKLMSRIHKL